MISRVILGMASLAVTAGLAAAQTPATAPVFPARPAPAATTEGSQPRPTSVEVSGDPACPLVLPCPPCGPPGCAWVNLEWLFWAASGQPLPPLVTASPPGTPRPLAGTLGSPTTTVAFGGRRTNTDFRNGFRMTGGFWLDDDQTCGIEGDFFLLGQSRQGFAAASDGSPVLARPFINALTGMPDAELVAFPGLVGRVGVDATSRAIGGGVNALSNLHCTPCGRLDLLWGYRYFGLTEEVAISEDLLAASEAGRVPVGSRFQIADRFRTENSFHGGVLGLAGERRCGRVFVGTRTSVALGGVQQITTIAGSTTITPPGGVPTTFPGGLLALPSNIGRYERTAFAVLPEVGLRVGVQVTEHARVYAGYNFLYLSNVARAGDQIDLRVNPNQLPPPVATSGPAVPQFPGRTTDYAIHGINVGVEGRF